MKKISIFFKNFAIALVGCGKDPILNSKDGTFQDSRDKHVYKWVRIGEQVWMAENLAYLPAVSPSSVDSYTSYYVYNYEGSSISEAKSKGNYTAYGVLYNWEAAKTACPSGWHLPSDAEWNILEDYLGAVPGKKMKSTTEWAENGNGDNSSGFNALPGGHRASGGFYYLGGNAVFWSSSEGELSLVCSRYLDYDDDGVGRNYYNRWDGFSVRCLQN
ncbi:MAG: FISUMP domain-containing protein [Bacteroidales bacterium]